MDDLFSSKILIRNLKTSQFQQNDMLSRSKIGLSKRNRYHINKKKAHQFEHCE